MAAQIEGKWGSREQRGRPHTAFKADQKQPPFPLGNRWQEGSLLAGLLGGQVLAWRNSRGLRTGPKVQALTGRKIVQAKMEQL